MAKVKLIAVNPKYRTLPFYCVPVYDENKREFITGQETLTPEELKKEPIIIDPELQYPIKHMQEFDTDKRKDMLILNLAKTQEEVAHNKRQVTSRTLFYVEDIEMEAEQSLGQAEKTFQAMLKVKESVSIAKNVEIAIYLGINPHLPASVVQDQIYKRCQTNPEEVLGYFDEANVNRLFVKKLIHHGILQRRSDRYVDGDLLVGRDESECVLFITDRKNESLVGKWGLALDRLEGRIKPEPAKSSKDEKKEPDASVQDIGKASEEKVPEERVPEKKDNKPIVAK